MALLLNTSKTKLNVLKRSHDILPREDFRQDVCAILERRAIIIYADNLCAASAAHKLPFAGPFCSAAAAALPLKEAIS